MVVVEIKKQQKPLFSRVKAENTIFCVRGGLFCFVLFSEVYQMLFNGSATLMTVGLPVLLCLLVFPF